MKYETTRRSGLLITDHRPDLVTAHAADAPTREQAPCFLSRTTPY
jgi:hypothetical protein